MRCSGSGSARRVRWMRRKPSMQAWKRVRRDIGFHPVFQCCEHLNRALVMEREAAEQYGLELVSCHSRTESGRFHGGLCVSGICMKPCLSETVQAHAGIDIGDTFIGMHLRRVAVPLRPSIRTSAQRMYDGLYAAEADWRCASSIHCNEADSLEQLQRMRCYHD